jgi:hypothetical protein
MIQISKCARWFNSDDGAVVFNITTGRYVGLNKTGTLIWLELTAGRELETVEDHLAAQFDVSRSTIKADLDSFISALSHYELIELDR